MFIKKAVRKGCLFLFVFNIFVQKRNTMKKALLYFVLLSLFVFSAGFTFGQVCTPDPGVTDPTGAGRLSPDTIDATELLATNLTLTIICPDTASVGSSGHITLHHITVKNLLNKPAWMTYTCNPSNCAFPAGVAKCVLVTGIPPCGSAGYYSIDVIIDVYMDLFGSGILVQSNYNSGMPLVVWVHEGCGVDIAEGEYKGFGILPPQPNPFNSAIKLGCYTETPQTVSLRVFDMVGKEVYAEKANTNAGENYFSFNGSDFNDGVYFYSVTDEQGRIITKKFIKSRQFVFKFRKKGVTTQPLIYQ